MVVLQLIYRASTAARSNFLWSCFFPPPPPPLTLYCNALWSYDLRRWVLEINNRSRCCFNLTVNILGKISLHTTCAVVVRGWIDIECDVYLWCVFCIHQFHSSLWHEIGWVYLYSKLWINQVAKADAHVVQLQCNKRSQYNVTRENWPHA